jgi:hypothetical protein
MSFVLHHSCRSARGNGAPWSPEVPVMQHKDVRAVLVTGRFGVSGTAARLGST